MRTTLDYMMEHPDENMSYCKPYQDDSGAYTIIMFEGHAETARTPDGDIYGESNVKKSIKDIAIAVNPDYDLYQGWSDLHIALEAMHVVGCASCPYVNGECDAMMEEDEMSEESEEE